MSSYTHHSWCFLKPLITPHVHPSILIFRWLWLQWSQSPIYRRQPSLLEELLPSEGAVSEKHCDWPPRSLLSYLAPTCASLFGDCRAQGHWDISNRVEATTGSAVQLSKCCALCEQRWQTLHEPLLLLLWKNWYLFSPPLIPSKIPFSDEYSLAELVDYGTPDLSSSIHALSKMTFIFLLFHFLYDFYRNAFYSSIARKSEWAWLILLNISFLLVYWNFFLNLINLSKQLDIPPICSLGHSYFLAGEECLVAFCKCLCLNRAL